MTKSLAPYSPINPTKEYWRILQLYCIYRLALASVFLSIHFLDIKFINVISENAFFKITLGYFLVAIILVTLTIWQKIRFSIQAHLGALTDLIAITTLMVTCGGMISGIGILLVIMIAGYSLLQQGKKALLGAILTSFCLLTAQYYTIWQYPHTQVLANHVALIIVLLFSTVLCLNWLTSNVKVKQSQLIETKQLAHRILSVFETGIIALNQDKILMINVAALKYFNLTASPQHINELPARIQNAIQQLQKGKRQIEIDSKFRLTLQNIPDMSEWLFIVYIYDLKAEADRAQNLKLAALGQMSANIAHEIRNPLSAISQASQLLHTEINNPVEIENLVSMINKNCHRINGIIENVLSLSKNEAPNRKKIELNEFVQQFARQYYPQIIQVENLPNRLFFTKTDPLQLEQILINLCENSIRHNPKLSQINIKMKLDCKPNNHISLTISDNGIGICKTHESSLFDPFFSTSSNGSGLGLALARALALANQAELKYLPQTNQGASFQLTFGSEGTCD